MGGGGGGVICVKTSFLENPVSDFFFWNKNIGGAEAPP